MITNNYIFEPISQTPDSVISTQQSDTTSTDYQNNNENNDFGFSLERKTLISTESADTIADIKPLPQTLRQYNYIKKVDTLKYARYYFTHIDSIYDNANLLVIDVMPSYKTKKKSAEKINKYLSKPKITKPKTNNKKHENTTETTLAQKKTKEKNIQENQIVLKEIISVEPLNHKNKININFEIGDWIIAIILISAFIFAWVRMFYNRNYKEIIKSGFNYQQAIKILKENNSAIFRVNAFLNFVFYLNISMFILLNIKFFNIKIHLNDWKTYFFIFIATTFVYFVKSFVYIVLGRIFRANAESKEYISTVWLYNKLLGIGIFPIIIFVPYAPLQFRATLMYIGIGLVVLSVIFRIIRSFNIAIKIKLSIFYLILYLCTLEILPILIIGKIVSNI